MRYYTFRSFWKIQGHTKVEGIDLFGYFPIQKKKMEVRFSLIERIRTSETNLVEKTNTKSNEEL
ncbi:hypothetical protein CH380_00275 [Leptospira adleri]|uniref:Uncharacterized protein n=1 Tax=Leptospira adleri TaxID=2023186 RepID=A0A2M9YTY5_9LEPT|nr:hypothetical protein CH380_00275 [Leptospira adleri]PJZ60933.1 hypothetical protein CH376_15930 [Leptospira adleri]